MSAKKPSGAGMKKSRLIQERKVNPIAGKKGTFKEKLKGLKPKPKVGYPVPPKPDSLRGKLKPGAGKSKVGYPVGKAPLKPSQFKKRKKAKP